MKLEVLISATDVVTGRSICVSVVLDFKCMTMLGVKLMFGVPIATNTARLKKKVED